MVTEALESVPWRISSVACTNSREQRIRGRFSKQSHLIRPNQLVRIVLAPDNLAIVDNRTLDEMRARDQEKFKSTLEIEAGSSMLRALSIYAEKNLKS